MIAAIPRGAGLQGEQTVSPSEPTAERSDRSARTEDDAHRAQEDGLWEALLSAANLRADRKSVV